jgi:hypothetical protein
VKVNSLVVLSAADGQICLIRPVVTDVAKRGTVECSALAGCVVAGVLVPSVADVYEGEFGCSRRPLEALVLSLVEAV